MELNQIIHGDAYEILPTIPDKSFDAIIIDPPYGMGIDTWDTPVDVAFFTEQIKRIGREFYAVFGQMPYIREWDRQAEKQGLKFLEHISWVKRNYLPICNRLSRGHEEIFIYRIDKKAKFYHLKGNYEDVRLPGIVFDIVSLESVKRYISDLWYAIKNDGNVRIQKCGRRHEAYKHLPTKKPSIQREVNYTNVWSFAVQSKVQYKTSRDKFHATTKPLLLQERLVGMLTPENGSVLDCFSGSGTTAIACKWLNRQFLCIEKNQEFYEHSVERLNGDTYQPDLNLNEN